MKISDPIADLLTRIRNAGRAGHDSCRVNYSKIKKSILEILVEEGFIQNFEEVKSGDFTDYKITLKYAGKRRPVIQTIQRESRPGRRKYIKHEEIKPVKNNLGISIISTSKGIMTTAKAKKQNLGGELICTVC